MLANRQLDKKNNRVRGLQRHSNSLKLQKHMSPSKHSSQIFENQTKEFSFPALNQVCYLLY